MKTQLTLLAFAIVLSLLTAAAIAAEDQEFLPIGLTEEEMTRLDEIGMYHTRTAPPTGKVRNPSEWEPMQGVIIRYPFGISYSIIAELSEDLMVTTIVASASEQSTVTSYYNSNGVNMAHVDWVIAPTNSIWTRDYGPWFIFEESGNLGIVDPVYNRPRPYDDLIPGVIGNLWGLNVYGLDLATPGGNHMSDGLGMSMSTRLVWDENTSWSHNQIDSLMLAYLGNDYTVLDYIESSGIHHIDCWAKFLNPTTILVKDVPSSWPQYSLLNARAEWLSQQISPWGRPYTIYRVYCPTGTAYTNSIILNDKVFVPTFNSSADAAALQVYADAMPGYEILGFTGSWLDDDAIHCRTMGVPDSNMLFIDHVPLGDQTDTLNDYLVTCTIVDHSDAGLIMDSCKIFYSINGGLYSSAPLTATGGTDEYSGYIPAVSGIGDVSYYIQAGDNSGRVETHPFIGEPGAHQFSIDLPPNMEVVQTEFAVSVQPGESAVESLRVRNLGPGLLNVTLCTSDSWIAVDEAPQTIYPGDSADFQVDIVSAGLACGDHAGSVCYVSNDPVSDSGDIPVALHIYAPEMYIAESSFEESLVIGDTSSYQVTVSNNGPGRLDYEISCQMLVGGPAKVDVALPVMIGSQAMVSDKDQMPEPLYAATGRSYGGPDSYGHFWVDSDEPGGPVYDWVDISAVGTSVTLGDDEATAAIPIGFAFPFYDSVYTELYISSNGMIAFDDEITSRLNAALPTDGMSSLIAMFWDDLDPRRGGDIYYYFDDAAGRFIVAFDQILFYSGISGTGSLTFEAILYPDGAVTLQYGYMYPGTLNLQAATVGIQNAEGSDGLTVVYNADYMHSDLRIDFNAEHWLAVSSAGGSIDPMNSAEFDVLYDATSLEAGTYQGLVNVVSNDPALGSLSLPVTLSVTSSTWVCGDVDGNGSGPDISDLVYLVTYMFQGGPEPANLGATDVDGSGAGPDIADLVYLVTYMFQSGPDLDCP